MDERVLLLKMLKRLLSDLQNIQQKGTGYYTCEPFVSRFNKILKSALKLFPEYESLLDSFSPVEGTTSVDPLDKMKTMQKVMIEGDQLEVFLETAMEDSKK